MASLRTRLGALALGALAAIGCGGGPSEEDLARARAEYNLGQGLLEEQNPAGAFQHIQEALRLDPEFSEAHLLLGTLHMLRSEFEPAERHLLRAIETNIALGTAGIPALTPDARNTLGNLYIHMRRYDAAVEQLRLSTGDLMNRTPHLAWTNLGWAYLEQRDYPQASQALEQAVRLEPRNCNAWYRLGQVAFTEGEAGEAEAFSRADQALTHGLEVDDAGCRALQEAWRLRGEARARLGRRSEAITDFERCVELDGSSEAGRACAGFLADGS